MADPARELLSQIIQIINRHQGRNPGQAIDEIHEALLRGDVPIVAQAEAGEENDGEAT